MEFETKYGFKTCWSIYSLTSCSIHWTPQADRSVMRIDNGQKAQHSLTLIVFLLLHHHHVLKLYTRKCVCSLWKPGEKFYHPFLNVVMLRLNCNLCEHICKTKGKSLEMNSSVAECLVSTSKVLDPFLAPQQEKENNKKIKRRGKVSKMITWTIKTHWE